MRYYSILLFFIACVAFAALPEGEIRFSLDGRNLLVPIPEEWQVADADIMAVSDSGVILSVKGIMANRRLCAVAVECPAVEIDEKTKRMGSIRLVSLGAIRQKKNFGGLPVKFERYTLDLTTRGLTDEEMIRMFAGLHLIPFPQMQKSQNPVRFSVIETKAFGNTSSKPDWRYAPEVKHHPFMMAVTAQTAMMAFPRDARVCFGATAQVEDRNNPELPQCAWTILYDGIPVANWNDSSIIGKDVIGGSIDVSAGLHCIQLLTSQYRREELPRLLVREHGVSRDPVLLPATIPETLGIRVDGREYLCTQKYVYGFQTEAGIQQVYAFDVDGKLVFSRDGETPDVVVTLPNGKNATFVLGARWRYARCATFGVQMKTAPLWQRGQKNAIQLQIDIPKVIPENWHGFLRAEAALLNAEGIKLSAADAEIKKGPSGNTVDLDLPWAKGATHLWTMVYLGDVPISIPRKVPLITPTDTQIGDLTLSGDVLYRGNQRVQLVATDGVDAPAVKDGVELLWDDAVAVSSAPGGDVTPELAYLGVKRIPGGNPALGRLTQLKAVLDAKPKRVYITANPDYIHYSGWRECLAFTVMYLNSQGIEPILVTLPSWDASTPNARAAAHLVKSLGMAQNVSVVDLYSKSQIDRIDTSAWKQGEGVELEYLNNDGRKWIFQRLK